MKQKLSIEERTAMVRLYNAYDMLNNARENMEHGFYKGAVNRLYYGAFYIVNGLLLKHGITASTHNGVFNQFSLHFIHSGRLPVRCSVIYRRLLEERSKGDYDIFTLFDRETVEEYLAQAQEFITMVEEEIEKGGGIIES